MVDAATWAAIGTAISATFLAIWVFFVNIDVLWSRVKVRRSPLRKYAMDFAEWERELSDISLS